MNDKDSAAQSLSIEDSIRKHLRDEFVLDQKLVLHRTYTQDTVARCSTCDGGGCWDCTDPA